MNTELFTHSKPIAKPFLKWAGGKSQLLQQFERFFPSSLKDGRIKYYYEPFVGGGAVYFYLKSKYQIKKAYLYDINDDLVMLYNTVKSNVDKLIELLEKIEAEYKSLTEASRKEYYYSKRNELNSLDIDYQTNSYLWIVRSALIIFLNKTCFNGLYRVNKSGKFNVPFGDYKNPTILNESNLRNTSILLEDAIIEKKHFSNSLEEVSNNSFVYLDPPYLPISKSSSFTSYSKFSFGIEEQILLSQKINKLSTQNNVMIMLSNSDPKVIDPANNFFEEQYSNLSINRVAANRMINSKAAGRGKIFELVITNYEF